MTHARWFPYFLLVFLMMGTQGCAISRAEDSPSPLESSTPGFWNAFMPKVGGGVFAVVPKTGEQFRISPMMELGIEKGWTSGKHFYIGVDLTWTVYFPDSFQDQVITISNTRVPPWVLLITPIPHVHFGYITQDDLLITIGPAYLWGLTATVRTPVSKSSFLAAEATWFFDRILFNTGLHDFYLNVLWGFRL